MRWHALITSSAGGIFLVMQTIIISRGNKDLRESKALEHILDLLGDHQAHPDLHTIEVEFGKQVIPIEKARELIKIIHVKPRKSVNKVIWMKEAHDLSLEAQNSLLKVLEEPPEYAQVILTVDHHENLIETIRSRCLLFEISDNVQSVVLEDELKGELLKVVAMKFGERIDWAVENKSLFSDRNDAIQLLDKWIIMLRDLMLLSESELSIKTSESKLLNQGLQEDLVKISKMNNSEYWSSKIKLAQKIKSGLQKNNANTGLAIEALLVNI